MADSSGTSTGKGNFSKIIQKSVTRTKEKVLQNLGKADRTRDDDFEQHVQNFNDQQAMMDRLQKELKHYTACVKEMSVASHNMYRTIKETYEINWTGYTEVTSSVEQMTTLWDDYMTKLTDQVVDPVNTYVGGFQDMKKLISKRGRKLTDYDSARHNHESLCTAKRHDEAKITKALDELNEAKQVYENFNTKLHEELPSFHASRIGFLASLFNSLFTAEAVFEHETAKLKDVMSDVTHKLGEESNRENSGVGLRSCGVPLARSDSDIENQKLENIRYSSIKINKKNQASRIESEKTTSSKAGQPTPAARSLSNSNETVKKKSAASPINNLERSPIHGSSSHYKEAESSSENEKTEDVKVDSNAEGESNGVYSYPKPIDDIYKLPTSNQPINSLYPDTRVLYKVVATHAYVGDDTDELSFEPGEIIAVVPFDDPEEQDEGWLTGVKELTKEKGVFPENFTKRLE